MRPSHGRRRVGESAIPESFHAGGPSGVSAPGDGRTPPRLCPRKKRMLRQALSRNDAVGNRELRSAVPVGQRFQPVHEFTNADSKRSGQTNVHFPLLTALQGWTGRMPVLLVYCIVPA